MLQGLISSKSDDSLLYMLAICDCVSAVIDLFKVDKGITKVTIKFVQIHNENTRRPSISSDICNDTKMKWAICFVAPITT